MNDSLSILCFVLFLVVFQYLMEVHVGGNTCIHVAKSGASTLDCTQRKSTPSQFLGLAAPLQLAGLGLPLLAKDFLAGALLVALALILFIKFRGTASIRNSATRKLKESGQV